MHAWAGTGHGPRPAPLPALRGAHVTDTKQALECTDAKPCTSSCMHEEHGILHACLSTIRAPAHVSVMRCFIHTRTPSHPSITPPSCAAHCMHACGPAGTQPHRRTVTAKSTGARPQLDTAGCCASTQVQFKLFATRILEERGAQAKNRRCGRRQRAPTWSVSAPRRPPQATGLVRPEASRRATGQGQRAGGQARTAAARPAWVGCAAGQCAGGQARTAAARPAWVGRAAGQRAGGQARTAAARPAWAGRAASCAASGTTRARPGWGRISRARGRPPSASPPPRRMRSCPATCAEGAGCSAAMLVAAVPVLLHHLQAKLLRASAVDCFQTRTPLRRADKAPVIPVAIKVPAYQLFSSEVAREAG